MERSENQSELSRRLCMELSGKGQMLDNLLSGPSPMLPVECLMGCDFAKNIHRPSDPSLQIDLPVSPSQRFTCLFLGSCLDTLI